MYVSQEEVFSDFNNTEALFWYHRDLVYGDWTTGENGDGCYEHYKELEIPEVRIAWDGGVVQLGGGVTQTSPGKQARGAGRVDDIFASDVVKS